MEFEKEYESKYSQDKYEIKQQSKELTGSYPVVEPVVDEYIYYGYPHGNFLKQVSNNKAKSEI